MTNLQLNTSVLMLGHNIRLPVGFKGPKFSEFCGVIQYLEQPGTNQERTSSTPNLFHKTNALRLNINYQLNQAFLHQIST